MITDTPSTNAFTYTGVPLDATYVLFESDSDVSGSPIRLFDGAVVDWQI